MKMKQNQADSELVEENKRLKAQLIDMQKKISETLSKKNSDADNTDKKIFDLEHQLQMALEDKVSMQAEIDGVRKELSGMKDELKKKVN